MKKLFILRAGNYHPGDRLDETGIVVGFARFEDMQPGPL
jgi:hypothetical protein